MTSFRLPPSLTRSDSLSLDSGPEPRSWFDLAATGRDDASAAGRAAPPPADEGPSAGLIGAAIAGQLMQAYAGYHQVAMQQIEKRSQADFLGHRARLLDLDYRAALQRAESVLAARQSEVGRIGLEGAQRRAEDDAANAARGITAGVGSAAEIELSQRLVESIDVYNVSLASVRSANAARRQATAIRNEAAIARVSARNLRRSARYAMPEAQLIAGLASTGGSGLSLAGA